MEPPPARRIAGTAYFTQRKTPSRFTAVCRRQSVNDISTALHKIPIPLGGFDHPDQLSSMMTS